MISIAWDNLWLDVSALVAGNMQQVLTVLQQGLTSAEHQQFVQAIARSI